MLGELASRAKKKAGAAASLFDRKAEFDLKRDPKSGNRFSDKSSVKAKKIERDGPL
jgi:hypothetical protein